MNIPKKNRPKWATHFMFQYEQRGCGGYWVSAKTCQIQQVSSDGSLLNQVETASKETMVEYLKGQYNLTVQRLVPIILENK